MNHRTTGRMTGLFLTMKRILLCLAVMLTGLSAGAQEYLSFKCEGVFRRAVNVGDKDRDGKLTREEAAAIETLDLSATRSDLIIVTSYEDLRYMPKLRRLWTGTTRLDRIDLSANADLEWIYIESPSIQTLLLSRGCMPEIVMKQEWMGETLPQPEIIYLSSPVIKPVDPSEDPARAEIERTPVSLQAPDGYVTVYVPAGLFPEGSILQPDGSQKSVMTQGRPAKQTRPKKPRTVQEIDARPALLGISTNLLLDGITALNLGVEVPLGNHWDARADVYFPWWKNNAKSFCFQVLHFDAGARYYFEGWKSRDAGIFRGWFASAHLGGGYYDIAPWGDGYQGWEITGGIGGGYSVAIGNWWRLDASLAVGPFYTDYITYQDAGNRSVLIQTGSDRRFRLLPTDVRISLTYILH